MHLARDHRNFAALNRNMILYRLLNSAMSQVTSYWVDSIINYMLYILSK